MSADVGVVVEVGVGVGKTAVQAEMGLLKLLYNTNIIFVLINFLLYFEDKHIYFMLIYLKVLPSIANI